MNGDPRPHATSPHSKFLTSRDSARSYFDKISGVYDLLNEEQVETVRDRALDALAIQSGERVLEIGCGTGHATIAIAEAVGSTGHVDAIDLAPKMIRQAMANVHAMDLQDRVTFVAADAGKLPFQNEMFDAVFVAFTLELFSESDRNDVLDEIKRVLRPGGRLGMVSFSGDDEVSHLERLRDASHRHFPNFLDCDPIPVAKVLESAGFTIRSNDSDELWLPVAIVIASL